MNESEELRFRFDVTQGGSGLFQTILVCQISDKSNEELFKRILAIGKNAFALYFVTESGAKAKQFCEGIFKLT